VDEIDDYRNSKHYSDREKAILMLADWMSHGSKGQMDEETLAALKRNFTEAEIIELGSYFALVTGFQKFNSVFNVLYQCEI
jgi:alkylhydroperoxidase family enzyme